MSQEEPLQFKSSGDGYRPKKMSLPRVYVRTYVQKHI
jgi:hypothetical protein